MKVILKISDIDIDGINFERSNMSTDEYINMLRNYEATTGRAIGEILMQNHGDFSSYAKFGRHITEDRTKYIFPSCPASTYNINEQDMSNEELKSYAQNNCQFILIIKLNLSEMEDDFETNIKQWRDNYERLSSYPKATDEWILKNTQANDILVIDEVTKETFMLHQCKIVSLENKDTYAFCVMDVTLI